MRSHFGLLVHKAIACAIVASAFLAWSSPVHAVQNQIFSEDFEGGTGARLDGTTEDASGATWIANGFATDNGAFDVGDGTPGSNGEGSAVLPITLVPDAVYTVELEVTTNAAEWIGIGFSENAPMVGDDGSAAFNRPQDRFAQSGGRAWFLCRPGEVGPMALAMQVEIFGGSGTANIILDSGTNFSGPLVTRTMAVVLNTASTGATADFLIDGVSQSNGAQPLFEDGAGTIPLTDLTLLANVGFTWEGQSPGNAAGAITVDNFSVTDNLPGPGGMLGDVNLDGEVDFFDIQPFVDVLSNQGNQFEADIDGDGEVTFFDIQGFIDLLAGGG